MKNIKNDSMNTVLTNNIKREYQAPEIVVVGLDNEISLQLASNPPFPEDEGMSKGPEFFDQQPFHANVC